MNDSFTSPSNNPSAEVPGKNGPLSLSDRVRSLRLPQGAAAPRRRIPWLPWTLCAVLGVTTVYFGLRAFGGTSGANNESSASPAGAQNLVDKSGPTDVKLAPGAIVLESKG